MVPKRDINEQNLILEIGRIKSSDKKGMIICQLMFFYKPLFAESLPQCFISAAENDKRVRDMKNYMPFHNHFRALSACPTVMVQMVPFDPHLQLFQPQNQYLLPHMGCAWQLQNPDAKLWNVFLQQHHLGLWPASFFIVCWMFTLIALLGRGTTCGTC